MQTVLPTYSSGRTAFVCQGKENYRKNRITSRNFCKTALGGIIYLCNRQ